MRDFISSVFASFQIVTRGFLNVGDEITCIDVGVNERGFIEKFTTQHVILRTKDNNTIVYVPNMHIWNGVIRKHEPNKDKDVIV
jgi:small-conductance mechanosensitive channel